MKRSNRRVSRGVAAGGALVMLSIAGAAAAQAVAGGTQPTTPHLVQPAAITAPLASAPRAVPPAAAQQAAPKTRKAVAPTDHRHYDGPGRNDDGFRGSKRGWGMRSNGFVDGVLAGTSYGYAFGSRYGQFGGYPYYGQGFYSQYPISQYPYGTGGSYPYGQYPYSSGTFPYSGTAPYGTGAVPYAQYPVYR